MKKLISILVAVVFSFALKTATAERTYINVQKEYVADIYSPSQVMIATRVMGFIKKIYVDEGDYVRKGQTLFVVDPSDIYSMMSQAKGAMLQAQSGVLMAEMAYADARKDYERFKNLYQQGAVSKRDFEKMKLMMNIRRKQVEMAKGMLKQAKAGLRMAENQLKYAKVKSPIDGIVTNKLKKVAEMALPGYPVLILSDVGNLKAKSFVKEEDINKLKVGMPVTIKIPAIKAIIPARISTIVPSADNVTHSYIIKYSFRKPRKLLPGMYAKAYINISKMSAVLIPYSALTSRGGILGVFVVKNKRAIFMPIKQLAQRGSKIAVEGLNGGEKIILYPPVNLIDGQRI